MSCRDTFETVAQACRVPLVRASGNPLANPSTSRGTTRGLAYTLVDDPMIYSRGDGAQWPDSNR